MSHDIITAVIGLVGVFVGGTPTHTEFRLPETHGLQGGSSVASYFT